MGRRHGDQVRDIDPIPEAREQRKCAHGPGHVVAGLRPVEDVAARPEHRRVCRELIRNLHVVPQPVGGVNLPAVAARRAVAVGRGVPDVPAERESLLVERDAAIGELLRPPEILIVVEAEPGVVRWCGRGCAD